MGTNPWFNIPHAADDDFVRQLAILLKSTLRPDLKVGKSSYYEDYFDALVSITTKPDRKAINLLDSRVRPIKYDVINVTSLLRTNKSTLVYVVILHLSVS